MAPSPAVGTKSNAAPPKTPTKLARRPGQIAPGSAKPLSTTNTPHKGAATAKSSTPMTGKGSGADSRLKPGTDSQSPANTDDVENEDMPEDPQTRIEMREEDDAETEDQNDTPTTAVHNIPDSKGEARRRDQTSNNDNDDDGEPLSKATQDADTSQLDNEDEGSDNDNDNQTLESAEPRPISDDDDYEQIKHGSSQHSDADPPNPEARASRPEDTEEKDHNHDEDEEADDTASPSTPAKPSKQTSTGGRAGSLLRGAQGLAGRATGLLGRGSKAAKEDAQHATDSAQDATQQTKGAAGDVHETADDAVEGVDGTAEDAAGQTENAVQQTDEQDVDDIENNEPGDDNDEDDDDNDDDAATTVHDPSHAIREKTTQQQETPDIPTDVPEKSSPDLSVLRGLEVRPDGMVLDQHGTAIGQLTDGDAEDLAGYPIGEDGEILDDDGDLVGRVELLPDAVKRQQQQQQEGTGLRRDGEDYDDAEEEEGEGEEGVELPSLAILQGRSCQIDGLIYDDEGNTIGKVVEGDAQDLQNARLNEHGEFVDDEGNVLGRAEIHEDAAELVRQGLYAADGADEDAEGEEGKEEEEGEGQQDEQEAELDGEAIEEEEEGEDEEKGNNEAAPQDAIEDQLPGIEALQGKELNEAGEIVDEDGNVVGGLEDSALQQRITDGDLAPDTLQIDGQGQVVDAEGNVLGKTKLNDNAQNPPLDMRIVAGKKLSKKGKILDDDGEEIAELADGDLTQCVGKKVNEEGEVLDRAGNVLGHVRLVPGKAAETATRELLEELAELAEEQDDVDEEEAQEAEEEQEQVEDEGHDNNVQEVQEDTQEEQQQDPSSGTSPVSILEGLKVNKKGQVLDEDGEPIGELTVGDLAQCAGQKINATGEVLDKQGNVIGHVRTLPQAAQDGTSRPAVSILEGLKVGKNGKILNEDGEPIGELTSGDLAVCKGKKINAQGEVLDEKGNVIGAVRTLAGEDADEVDEIVEEDAGGDEGEDEDDNDLPPLSTLEGLTVNKSGKILNANGTVVGELIEGDAKKIWRSGATADAKGQFWDNKGHVIGRAQTLPLEDAEAEAAFAGLEGLHVVEDGWVQDENGHTVGQVTEGDAKKLIGRMVDEDGDILDKRGSVVGHADRYEPQDEEAPEEDPAPDLSFLQGRALTKSGLVIGDDGAPVARLVEGNMKDLAGRQIDDNGQIWNDKGKVIGRVELIPEEEREQKPEGPFAGLQDLRVIAGGKVADGDGNVVGEIVEGNARRLVGLAVDEDGDIVDRYGTVKGHAQPLEEEPEEEPTDYSVLDGMTVNKQGFVVDAQGVPVGKLVEGNSSELAGRQCDENGLIHNDRGKVVGRCEPLPEDERVAKPEGPFAGRQGLRVVKGGKVEDEDGNVVGEITEGNAKRLVGLAVDEDGDIIDKFGNTKGHAEPIEEEEEEPIDNSLLNGKTLNKQGFVVDEQGIPFGRLVEGVVTELAGRKCDEQGYIYGDTGKVVGRCEILPENERVARPEGPFAGLEGLRVVKQGKVEDIDGNVVGEITEGDPKRLVGLHVDEDGDIIDKYGNVKGHAEPWSEDEPEAIDLSRLAGTTINKAGYAVDGSGQVIGRVAEGDSKIMIGKKVDGQGQIWDEAGNVIGRAELAYGVDKDEGPFAGFEHLQIQRDGTVTTPTGDIVGRIIEGDIKKLLGHTVDEDGDITDKNGNTIGKAERWEPEEKERHANPMSGRRVNKQGEVRDENGDLMGRLTMGDLGHCVGQEIDDSGNVVDIDGNKIGEVTLIENIIDDDYEGPSEEELAEAAKRDEEREIAAKMGNICQQTLDRMQPICKQITEYMEQADRTPKDELDEEELVDKVKPLIEEGGRILQECNGALRGLDPDGRIAAQAKGRAGTGEATPEEYRLAETLKELTTTVVTCIDNAKKKLNHMPHAKRKLNPLWGLLTQPLFQILAAVGLLLAGVLGLVGQLLNGLGLGGLVNALLGGLGINKLLSSLGLLGGDDGKGKKKKSGGLSSLPIVGGFLGGN